MMLCITQGSCRSTRTTGEPRSSRWGTSRTKGNSRPSWPFKKKNFACLFYGIVSFLGWPRLWRPCWRSWDPRLRGQRWKGKIALCESLVGRFCIERIHYLCDRHFIGECWASRGSWRNRITWQRHSRRKSKYCNSSTLVYWCLLWYFMLHFFL